MAQLVRISLELSRRSNQDIAAKTAKEKERVGNCQKQATEQKVLSRDRTQFLINCLEKIAIKHRGCGGRDQSIRNCEA
jgi:hypothetical protein